jgi:hypothetical protein
MAHSSVKCTQVHTLPHMLSDVVDGSAHVVLAEAYQDESRRVRARARRWLPWLAWHMEKNKDLAWWVIPAWDGGRNLRTGKSLLKPIAFVPIVIPVFVLAPFIGLGTAMGAGVGIGFLSLPYIVLLGISGRRYQQSREPVALVPRQPRGWRQWGALVLGVSTGVLLRPALVKLWLTPTTDYRACRRSFVLDVASALLSGSQRHWSDSPWGRIRWLSRPSW